MRFHPFDEWNATTETKWINGTQTWNVYVIRANYNSSFLCCCWWTMRGMGTKKKGAGALFEWSKICCFSVVVVVVCSRNWFRHNVWLPDFGTQNRNTELVEQSRKSKTEPALWIIHIPTYLHKNQMPVYVSKTWLEWQNLYIVLVYIEYWASQTENKM